MTLTWNEPRRSSNSTQHVPMFVFLQPLLPSRTFIVHYSSTSFFFFSASSPHTNLYKQCKSLVYAKRICQQLLVRGRVDMAADVVTIYTACDSPSHAMEFIHRSSPSSPNLFWWNALIRCKVSGGLFKEAIDIYGRMTSLSCRPDHYTFPFVIKACGELPSSRRGASVHAAVCRNGFFSNVFVCNSLVSMYGRCGILEDARKVFDDLLQRGLSDVISWNSIVASYVHGGQPKSGLAMFDRMTDVPGLLPDAVGLVNVLTACASEGECLLGKQAHAYAFRSAMFDELFVGNAIVDMYVKCRRMGDAEMVFQRLKVKDVVSWNAMVTGYSQVGRFEDAVGLFEKMKDAGVRLNVVTWSAVIAGYAQRCLGYEAVGVFHQMQCYGLKPNVVTLVSLLSGCASVGALLQGKEAHCYSIRQILVMDEVSEDDMMVINGLIDMYCKCKSAVAARIVFDLVELRYRNVVTWTSMIGGYAQHGEATDALNLFSQMLQMQSSIRPNAFTISSALMACARLAALRFGREIHSYAMRNHSNTVLFVSNCLIDMYAKSGDVDAARIIFDRIHERNSVSWTSLMAGYGLHGRGREAVQVFDKMKAAGVVPDSVTSVVFLYVCSHSGMINEGIDHFYSMKRDFGVVAGVEHYSCMVDLLGRAGRLSEAKKLITGMPMKPCEVIWVALLGACRIHGNVELAEFSVDRLRELQSENDGVYTLLSNVYANARRWKDVSKIRCLMKYSGIRKRPGCSWVQGKKVASFFAGDRSHPMSPEIYSLLADLIDRIRAMGYVPEVGFALHDVDDEEKGHLLFEHSEKLALAYGILTSLPKTPIRIVKNLRVCGDCHTAIMYISRIIKHEIIIRDPSRFHHFKDGSCSCGGYW